MSAGACDLQDVHDQQEYGGKAVGLGVAVRAGLPVPPGAALPAGLVESAAAGEPAAAEAVRRAALDLGVPLAVRSSAVGEDGTQSSFAGQHLTLLNVCRVEDVLPAVREVVASASATAATAYRCARGDSSAPRTGVVLQRLVPADVAGVLFSRNPVSSADEFVIEASWALGEAVVGGLVTPDLFRLDRNGQLLEVTVGQKDLAVVPRQGGGTAVLTVDRGKSGRPCLQSGQLDALAVLGRRCDEVFGGPSDVEWAFAGRRLALLQRRPITVGAC